MGSPSTARRNVHVLIVDDNEDATETLSILLEMRDCTTSRAHSGQEALEAFDSRQPDLVLLDLGLPDIDGYAVASRMRAKSERPMLVALTGAADDETAQAVRRTGFAHHLIKPVDLAALEKILVRAAG
jgi:CheY-like chemotaxis protein